MGLSAQELNAETLYPGDTIEYFSMVSVICVGVLCERESANTVQVQQWRILNADDSSVYGCTTCLVRVALLRCVYTNTVMCYSVACVDGCV